MIHDFGVNQGLVEELYLRYCENPSSVDETWREYFEKLDNGGAEDDARDVEIERTTAVALPAPPRIPTPAPPPHGQAQARTASGEAKPTNGEGNGGNGNGARAIQFLPPTAEIVPPFARAVMRTSFPPAPEMLAATELQGRVSAFINAHRVRGHLFAKLDPLGLAPETPDELSLEAFGLDAVDPDTIFSVADMAGPPTQPLHEVVRRVKETYCRTIGAEHTFIEDPAERAWLQERMESTCNRLDLSREEQLLILTKLTDAEIFEQFLHTNYIGAKRFSLEGGESTIPLLELLIESASRLGCEELIIAMAHRGRLNVLANVMEKSLREIFVAFEDDHPELNLGRGDVKYHLGYSADRITSSGKRIHMSLAFNPSHLEWVNPVVAGRVRAKQDRRQDADRSKVVPLLIHGDAAFVAQGVVAETLNLGGLRGYSVGGTIHVVINNQIGFTTSPEDGRSTRYATDITRMLRCPVFHVNGEDPEAVAQVVRLSAEFRQRFHRDVVIDMYCYRRYGHNETDEPRFTQPIMYAAIDRHPTVREVYVRRLVEMGKITEEQAEEIAVRRRRALEDALKEARKGGFIPPPYAMGGVWESYKGGPDVEVPDTDTSVALPRLHELLTRITEVPAGFRVHPKIETGVLAKRRECMDATKKMDWGTAEALAFASLLTDGTPVRFSGQDARRGTFSHRHAVLFDAKNGKTYTPLAHLAERQARFEIWDSPLSEAGVVGFEFGYSIDSPDALVIWEAQFGDFGNCAQVIIDQFISSSEDKWFRLSGLVLLLPHGFEGQGPEHSSARLERFLVLSAEDNIQVCNLTTSAQFFHCLRRQIVRPWRKPLVVMTPKSLLRHPKRGASSIRDLAEGTFRRILPDESANDPSRVRRVLLCSGKVYYDLAEQRERTQAQDIAIVRFEQLYPLRRDEIRDTISRYPEQAELFWVQEEPFNSGGWYFMNARLPEIVGRPIRCVSRVESASPATGSHASHELEQRTLIEAAFART